MNCACICKLPTGFFVCRYGCTKMMVLPRILFMDHFFHLYSSSVKRIVDRKENKIFENRLTQSTVTSCYSWLLIGKRVTTAGGQLNQTVEIICILHHWRAPSFFFSLHPRLINKHCFFAGGKEGVSCLLLVNVSFGVRFLVSQICHREK